MSIQDKDSKWLDKIPNVRIEAPKLKSISQVVLSNSVAYYLFNTDKTSRPRLRSKLSRHQLMYYYFVVIVELLTLSNTNSRKRIVLSRV